jgi:hypothetical protein
MYHATEGVATTKLNDTNLMTRVGTWVDKYGYLYNVCYIRVPDAKRAGIFSDTTFYTEHLITP